MQKSLLVLILGTRRVATTDYNTRISETKFLQMTDKLIKPSDRIIRIRLSLKLYWTNCVIKADFHMIAIQSLLRLSLLFQLLWWFTFSASEYCRPLFRCLSCAQRFHYRALGSRLRRVAEHLIDRVTYNIRWQEGNEHEMYHFSISFLHVGGSCLQQTFMRKVDRL